MSAAVPTVLAHTTLWDFSRIPADMRAADNWICWRYAPPDPKTGKQKKTPLNARTGLAASVKEQSNYGGFTAAVSPFSAGACDGVGFCVNGSGYSVIDLDYSDDPEIQRFQDVLLARFDTYIEHSPSGKGYHIIVKGTVRNAQTDFAEILSVDCYATMTGHVWRDRPIADCQAQLAELADLLRPAENDATVDILSVPQVQDDAAVTLQILMSTKDSAKFGRLSNGNGSDLANDKSNSAIDMALVNMLANYTRNYEQIERLWLHSKHGSNPEHRKRHLNKPAYRITIITKAFRNLAAKDARRAIQDAMLQATDFTAAIEKAKADAAARDGYAGLTLDGVAEPVPVAMQAGHPSTPVGIAGQPGAALATFPAAVGAAHSGSEGGAVVGQPQVVLPQPLTLPPVGIAPAPPVAAPQLWTSADFVLDESGGYVIKGLLAPGNVGVLLAHPIQRAEVHSAG